jgi:carboxymethylenebutenolidase
LKSIPVPGGAGSTRDESSKGRWDAALTRSLFSLMMEVFERTVARDLGPKADDNLNKGVEHVC